MKSDKLNLSFSAKRPGTAEIAELLKQLRETRTWQSMENLARKAAELHPHQPEFHMMLGTSLHNQGKARAAEQAYGACLRIDPKNVRALINLGSLQISAGQPAAGLAAIDAALHLDPGNVEARVQKGRGLGVLGKPDEALKVFDELDAEQPDNVNVITARALCHMQIGHRTRAAELLSRALELAPDDPEIRAAMKKVAS